MGKEKDAGEILVVLYEGHQSWDRTRKKLAAKKGWDIGRIDGVIEYLHESKLIDVEEYNREIKGLGSHDIKKEIEIEFIIEEINLTKKGIATVKDPQTFKSTFGFEKPPKH